MKIRFLQFIVLATLLSGFLAACSNLAGPNDKESNKTTTQIAGIRPVLIDTVNFNFDETAPAASTLTQYPGVATWRLKYAASIPNSAVTNGNSDQLTVRAWVWGWDDAGNQVASGSVYMADEDAMDTWYSTVVVSGVALDMGEAGTLFESIVDDIEVGGDGMVGKTPCWLKAIIAAGALAAGIVTGAAALEACIVTGGLACASAVGIWAGAEVWAIDAILDWVCKCVNPNHPLCAEPMPIEP